MKDRGLLPLLFIGGGVLAFFALKDAKRLNKNIPSEKLFFEIKNEEDWNYIKNNEDKFKPLYWIVYPKNSDIEDVKIKFEPLGNSNSLIFIDEELYNVLGKKG